MCAYPNPQKDHDCLCLVLTTWVVPHAQGNVTLIDQAQCPANDSSITSRIHENKVPADPVTYILESVSSCPVDRTNREIEHCKLSSQMTEKVLEIN